MNFIPVEWQERLPLLCSAIDNIEFASSLDEAYAAGIQTMLGNISRSNEHRWLIRELAQKWIADPTWYKAVNSIAGNILLSQSTAGTIFAISMSTGVDQSKPRLSSPIDLLLCPLSKRGLTVNISTLCGSTIFEVPDSSLRVMDRTPMRCGQHETLGIRCGDVFDFADTDTMLLKIEFANRTALRFHFDAIDGRYVGASLSSAADSQLVAFINSLRATGDHESATTLVPFTRHRSHWVRWESLKTIAELDSDLALEVVRTMVDDPHPEIRRAAAKTLQEA